MNEYERYGEYSQQSPRETSGGANIGTAITLLLIGVGVGATAALLFTPMSGSELRGTLSRGYRSTIDGISQGTQRLRERSSNLLGIRRGKREEEQYKQG